MTHEPDRPDISFNGIINIDDINVSGRVKIAALVSWDGSKWNVLNPFFKDKDGKHSHWQEFYNCETMIKIATKLGLKKDKVNLIKITMENNDHPRREREANSSD